MEETTIRAARASDEAALGRYGGALMRLHHQFDPQRFLTIEHPEKGYGRFLVSHLADLDNVVLVAELRGEVVGYVWATLEPLSWKDLRDACGFIQDVFVDERARGAGIGARLTRGAMDELEARGAPRVVLMSAARNAPAQRLFERLGFRHTMAEMTHELNPAKKEP